MPLVIGLLLVIIVVWVLAGKRARPSVQVLERELRRLCLGNKAQAERLIQLELDRTPGTNRRQAIKAAIESYKRDS